MTIRNILSRLFLILLFLAYNCPQVSAQTPTNLNGWRPNGTINTFVEDANYMYLGGNFTSMVKPNVSGAVTQGTAVNTVGVGDAIQGFPAVINGAVRACIPDGAGGWYIGGGFFQVGGVIRNYIAHINPDKSLDMTWNPNANGVVYTLALSGTDLYVGGGFTNIGGQARNYIAKLSTTGTGTADATWNPGANNVVYTIALSGTDLYVGGEFTTFGALSRSRIAKISTAGVVNTTWNPNADGQVNSLILSGAELFVGGGFSVIGGFSRNRIAKLNTASGGTAIAAWNPDANGTVNTLAISGTVLYVGGQFTNIGGQARNYIAKLSTTSSTADATWNPNANDNVHTLAVSGTDVYAGGSFTTMGGQSRNFIAKIGITGTGVVDATWNLNTSNTVQALAIAGTDLYVGGAFTSIGGQNRSCIARIQKSNMELDMTWNPNANRAVDALAHSGTDLYVGGWFTTIGGQSRNYIAKISTTGTGLADATWNPNPNLTVNALVISGTGLYAGGQFTTIGGQTRNSIAKLSTTGTGLADATWNPNANNYVGELTISGTDLFVGGSFTNIGGQARNRIAKLSTTGTGLADAAWNPNANDFVASIAVSGTDLYVGGPFTNIGGLARNRIAKLSTTGTGAADATWNPGASSSVSALAISGTSLYVGGFFFSTIGGQSRNYIAKLSTTGTGAADATWNPNANNVVYTLILSGGNLYVGGDFTRMGFQNLQGLATFDVPGLILSTTTLSGFSTTPLSASNSQSFTISGINLTADALLSLSTTDWELSTDNITFSATLNLTQSGGTLTGQPTTVYVRLKSGLSTGNKMATLTARSTGAADKIISLSGSNKDNQTITFNTLPAKIFGDVPFALSASSTSNLSISYSSSNTSVATISGNTVTIVGTGSTDITASQAGNDNFNPATSVVQMLTVGKANQTITFNALPVKTFGNASFALTASATSNLPILYSSSNTSVATVSGNTVTIIGAGSTDITASQAGNTNYNSATSVVQTLTVDKANQTITFNALPAKTFGDAPFALTASSSSNLSISYSSSNTNVATISGNTITVVGAGTTTITASQAGNTNYNPATDAMQVLTVGKANQTITFNALPAKTFGDVPFALSATATSNLPISYSSSNTSVATVSGNMVTIIGAGTTTITASQAGNTNYNAATDATQVLTVGKANQTISFPTIADKVYGESPFALGATTNSNLAISYSITTNPTTGVATLLGNTITIVGLGSVTITASQVGNVNYNPATDVVRTFNIVYPTSVQSNVTIGEVIVFPNPNKSGIFEVRGLQSVDKTKINYVVIDASGKVIRQGAWAGKDVETLNLSNAVEGTYTLSLQGSKVQTSKKIIK